MTIASDFKLDSTQWGHVQELLRIAKNRPGLSEDERKRALDCMLACVRAESRFYNRGSDKIPESHQYADPGWSGNDYDSVGLFQQRPRWSGSAYDYGWGTVKQCMNVDHAAGIFLDNLLNVWRGRSNWLAIQAVQRSAFDDGSNYRAHDAWAIRLRKAIWGTKPTTPVKPAKPSKPSKKPKPTKLKVDRILGPATIAAEQRALGVTPDGIEGPVTIGAEQKRTGAKVDRIRGIDTNRHLQKHLNYSCGARLKIDGIRGAETIGALQRALNDGTF